jgi:hypothetical protein
MTKRTRGGAKGKKTRVPVPSASAQNVADAAALEPKHRALYDRLMRAIEKGRAIGAKAFDEVYEAAEKIVYAEPPLYRFEYETTAEFTEKVLGEEERNARRWMRVAKYATPDEERDVGVSKLDAAIKHIEARIGHPIDGTLPVAFDRLKIAVKRNGDVKKLLLRSEEVTVRDIDAATAELLRARRGELPAEHDAEDACRHELGKSKAFGDVDLKQRRGFMDFRGVPVGSLGLFAESVARAARRFAREEDRESRARKSPAKTTKPARKTTKTSQRARRR